MASVFLQQDPSTLPRKTRVWSARENKYIELPTGAGFNGNAGINFYLAKRLGGKRVFYLPAEVEQMTEAERLALACTTDDKGIPLALPQPAAPAPAAAISRLPEAPPPPARESRSR